jgi:hypothetical protein
MKDIADWQRRFYAQPRAYVVVDNEGVVDGVYESQEAAELAIDWARKRDAKLRVLEQPICSLQLSQERWR